ncbi:uncharacterized protein LOC119681674 [Teleopsis dalmanni]|uniref:uncharacterized protein LOC119681674 n=1 Tax=Teleopsis dalmanni TaxID=139649 RepID=UPI0018CE44CA|nr:uncharacterized protein LOC119681674 [Teleopsis dalmanni]
MKVLLKILAICALVYSTTGFALNIQLSGGAYQTVAESIKIISHIIFGTSLSANPLDLNASVDNTKLNCWKNYTENNIKALSSSGSAIKDCVGVSNEDIDAYFSVNNSDDFEGEFTVKMISCLPNIEQINCFTKTIVNDLQEMSSTTTNDSASTESCVQNQLNNVVAQMNSASDKLTFCLTLADL